MSMNKCEKVQGNLPALREIFVFIAVQMPRSLRVLGSPLRSNVTKEHI